MRPRPALDDISAALFGRPSLDAVARALDMHPHALRRRLAENRGFLPAILRAELLQMMIERRDRLNQLIDQESKSP